MFFGKKDNINCERCSSKINEEFSFCPYCGASTLDPEEEMREFGMLGKNDSPSQKSNLNNLDMGFTDQLVNSMMNSIMKSLDKQFKDIEKGSMTDGTEIKSLPNGIRIKIGPSMQQVPKKSPSQVTKKTITEDQIKKMSDLPRGTAKSKIRRLSDRVICELAVSGIESPKDIFISKLESGYEIKAIGKKKVYINNIPLELPIHGFSYDPDHLFIEFKTQEN